MLLARCPNRCRLVKLDTYTLLHISYIRIVNGLFRRAGVIVRFYEDLPSAVSAPPSAYRKLMPLMVALHLLGFLASQVKLLLAHRDARVLVEDEGFVFKQIPDLMFMAGWSGSHRFRPLLKLLSLSTLFLLIAARRLDNVIVWLRSGYGTLRARYRKRGTPVEPAIYVEFQESSAPACCAGSGSSSSTRPAQAPRRRSPPWLGCWGGAE
jgi:hypothetical protein